MSASIEEQLQASGVAQVLVVLKQPQQTAAAATTLRNKFRLAETAPQTALASAMAFRKGVSRAEIRRNPNDNGQRHTRGKP